MRHPFVPSRPAAAPARRRGGAARRRLAGVTALAAATMPLGGCGNGHPAAGPGGWHADAATGGLPQATTFTTLKGLPQDTAPATAGDGTVVHPTRAVTVSDAPGGRPVAVLPGTQLGGATWVPVIESRPGWRRVLLPSRPNRVSGWIADDAGTLRTAHSSYVVRVDRSARRLTLLRSGQKLGTWTVAVGAAKTPTPTGRTFMLASLAPARPTYSPLILPLGAHSETLDTFGGGPGTVAFHGWPDSSVFGRAITHGCIRVPSDALKKLSDVPLGTSVVITD